MVTDDPADLANAPGLPDLPRPDGGRPRRARAGPASRTATRSLIVRDAYQDGRYLFTGADLAARAATVGLVPKGDLIWYQAGTRLRPYGYPTGFVPEHRPPAPAGAAPKLRPGSGWLAGPAPPAAGRTRALERGGRAG